MEGSGTNEKEKTLDFNSLHKQLIFCLWRKLFFHKILDSCEKFEEKWETRKPFLTPLSDNSLVSIKRSYILLIGEFYGSFEVRE